MHIPRPRLSSYPLSILIAISIFWSTSGCEQKKEIDKKQYWNIVSIRTLGLAFLEENKLAEAKIEFEKLIEEAPDEASGYANLGLVYLRMGRYKEALPPLLEANKKQPEDPNILLILAKTYEQNGDKEMAIETLDEIIDIDPVNLKALYNLAEIYGQSSDPEDMAERLSLLERLKEADPGNIVVRLQLIEQLISMNEPDLALAEMEEVKKTFPEFSQEADEQYTSAMENLRQNNTEQAAINVMKFHNLLKLSTLYQSSVKDLRGPGGSLIGFPVITVSESTAGDFRNQSSILDLITFTDATATSGLDIIKQNTSNQAPVFATADYDSDGDMDLYIATGTSEQKIYLMNNQFGKYSNVVDQNGLTHDFVDQTVQFFDFNNDGYLDLFIGSGNAIHVFTNELGKGFIETGKIAELNLSVEISNTLALDADHDGDLDLFSGTTGADAMFQNNADGTFVSVSEKMGIVGQDETTVKSDLGDLDEDGDIDLVVNRNSGIFIYSNERQGRYIDITEESGISELQGAKSMTLGDYNNDGFPDIFSQTTDGKFHLLQNNGDAHFGEDERSANVFNTLTFVVNDLKFVDFDNDGHLDLLLVGDKPNKGRGVVLLHNTGDGMFEDASGLLPKELMAGVQIATADYNEDGDADFFISQKNGTVKLLRNDGGNNNHYLKMKLVGLRTGSGKNNHFGIGAKVEIRSQDLYQMYTVTEPEILIGIGHRKSADVVRIQWTNGVPQNIFTPSADKSLVESQVLKGSCPFLYTWDGEKYVFVKDMMWKSALGMPLGIMGGNTAYAFADASKEYMKIPGEVLKPKDGFYSMQITEELWETVYFDKAELMVVDHPAEFDIYVDERFSPPPYPDLKIYRIAQKNHPVAAIDDEGKDLLPLIISKDDQYIANFKPASYQGITDTRTVTLDLGTETNDNNLYLFLQGWIFPTDASINVATGQSSEHKITPLHVQVLDEQGNWVTVIENLGFPLGKDKTIIADLSGKFLSADRQVRLITNMEIYWDHIFFSQNHQQGELTINSLVATQADLHYRGFSRMYRKGGRYGPHWFDYQSVTTGQKWRDLIGNYTRYGDVKDLVLEGDDKYIIANAGDEITIQFDGRNLPHLPTGWTRDFLIYSEGWVKDGDMNTAHSKTVEPLPYHGIGSYPYGPADAYPTDDNHNTYQQQYNTRAVTPKTYNDAIRSYNSGDKE